MLRVALVGCGAMAPAHLGSLKRIPDVRLVAVSDVDVGRANMAASRFRVDRAYKDVSQMLAREKPDVLFILTPPQTHAAFAIQAMKAGSHVFLEKPLAVTAEECDQIIQVSKDTNRLVGVNHNRLFLPTTRKAKAVLDGGELGDLTGIEVRFLHHDPGILDDREHWAHKLPGGAFGECLPHALYLARDFLGNISPVAAARAKQGTRDWMSAEELRVILKGEKALGVITFSFNAPQSFEMMDIHGSKGNLHLALDAIFVKYGAGKNTRLSYALGYGSESAQKAICTLRTSIRNILGQRTYWGTLESIRSYVRAVRGQETLQVTAEDGKANVQTYQQILGLL